MLLLTLYTQNRGEVGGLGTIYIYIYTSTGPYVLDDLISMSSGPPEYRDMVRVYWYYNKEHRDFVWLVLGTSWDRGEVS